MIAGGSVPIGWPSRLGITKVPIRFIQGDGLHVCSRNSPQHCEQSGEVEQGRALPKESEIHFLPVMQSSHDCHSIGMGQCGHESRNSRIWTCRPNPRRRICETWTSSLHGYSKSP